jgi:SAM-dependent methyltransferase
MNCLICGASLKELGKVFGKEIYQCSLCGFGQTENLRNPEGIYHRDEVYIEEENLFKNIFQKRANIINNLSKPGRVLEVGCSTGTFLFLLSKKGWQVTGIEISKPAAKKGLNVTTKKFEDTEFKEKFDLIIFNHTLEHVDDPIGCIEKASSLLKNGGLLYIDLPNFGSLSARFAGLKWPLLLPKEHLWHFTEKSLNILLVKNKLKIVFTEKASGVWDYGSPIGGVFLSLINFKKRFFQEIITAIPTFLITKLGLGSDLMVIAKKI